MKMISTVKTELEWFSAIQFSPDTGCPVLVLMTSDEGFIVGMAEISTLDNEWRSIFDGARLDADDIEMWAEISLPKFHN